MKAADLDKHNGTEENYLSAMVLAHHKMFASQTEQAAGLFKAKARFTRERLPSGSSYRCSDLNQELFKRFSAAALSWTKVAKVLLFILPTSGCWRTTCKSNVEAARRIICCKAAKSIWGRSGGNARACNICGARTSQNVCFTHGASSRSFQGQGKIHPGEAPFRIILPLFGLGLGIFHKDGQSFLAYALAGELQVFCDRKIHSRPRQDSPRRGSLQDHLTAVWCRLFVSHGSFFSWMEPSIASRRILGPAEIQLAGKRATRQARPLTVQEVMLIHKMAADPDQNLVTKVMCVHLLLMLYCRCRNSDVAHVLCMTQLVTTSNRVAMVSFSYQPVTTSRQDQQKASHCFFP